MHLDDHALERLVDGESLGARHEPALQHLASCATCSAALDRMRADEALAADLLRALDGPPPSVDVQRLIERAAHRPYGPRRRLMAAGIGAIALAGAAAAMPGSPVRAYVARMFQPAPPGPTVAALVQPTPAAAADSTRQGVAFVPGPLVDIALHAVQRAGTLRITIVAAASVRLTHQGGNAAYSLTAHGVSIDNAGSTASFDLALPETVAHATVSVGGHIVFTKSGTAVQAEGARDSAGAFVIPLFVTTLRNRSIP